MTPATIVLCEDCGSAAPAAPGGWLRCPSCDAAYCPVCPSSHRITEHGECDSTQVCTACGSTCLVDF
jgi:hypothetical protein